MLSKEEKDFIEFWEANRNKTKSFSYKMLFGGPWGLIFAIPILIVAFFHDWYKRMTPISRSQAVLITLGVISIAFFYAYFQQQHRWENNEQLYKELKYKEKKEKEKENPN